jgi:hypothetical protein
MPYRDFASSYAALNPYVDAIAVSLWYSPLAIILLAILVEAALLPLWLHFGRELFSEHELVPPRFSISPARSVLPILENDRKLLNLRRLT